MNISEIPLVDIDDWILYVSLDEIPDHNPVHSINHTLTLTKDNVQYKFSHRNLIQVITSQYIINVISQKIGTLYNFSPLNSNSIIYSIYYVPYDRYILIKYKQPVSDHIQIDSGYHNFFEYCDWYMNLIDEYQLDTFIYKLNRYPSLIYKNNMIWTGKYDYSIIPIFDIYPNEYYAELKNNDSKILFSEYGLMLYSNDNTTDTQFNMLKTMKMSHGQLSFENDNERHHFVLNHQGHSLTAIRNVCREFKTSNFSYVKKYNNRHILTTKTEYGYNVKSWMPDKSTKEAILDHDRRVHQYTSYKNGQICYTIMYDGGDPNKISIYNDGVIIYTKIYSPEPNEIYYDDTEEIPESRLNKIISAVCVRME